MYYFAYGSNLNKGQMRFRCPKAKPVGKVILPDARLVFKGPADVECEEGSEVQGGLWKITKACEIALDRYEGVRSGMYRKEYIAIAVAENGKREEADALIYLMNSDEYYPPTEGYVDCIRMGYRDFGLDLKALTAAVKRNRAETRRHYRDLWEPRIGR